MTVCVKLVLLVLVGPMYTSSSLFTSSWFDEASEDHQTGHASHQTHQGEHPTSTAPRPRPRAPAQDVDAMECHAEGAKSADSVELAACCTALRGSGTAGAEEVGRGGEGRGGEGGGD